MELIFKKPENGRIWRHGLSASATNLFFWYAWWWNSAYHGKSLDLSKNIILGFGHIGGFFQRHLSNTLRIMVHVVKKTPLMSELNGIRKNRGLQHIVLNSEHIKIILATEEALEDALEAICSFLDSRAKELETNAYPVLDEFTSKVDSVSYEF